MGFSLLTFILHVFKNKGDSLGWSSSFLENVSLGLFLGCS